MGEQYAAEELYGEGETRTYSREASALRAVFEHNFLADFSAHHNCNRTYALNDDAGLLMCRWPRGGRPDVSFPYCDEVMSGFAYQAAAHMISMGLVDEGLTVVKAIRERHDGVKRNPYNEFECGNHYARTMANWSVYEELCGYRFDLTNRDAAVNEHGFTVDPVLDREVSEARWLDNGGELEVVQNPDRSITTVGCTGYPYGTDTVVRVAKLD